MTNSVSILIITDMKEDKRIKRIFGLLHKSIIFVSIIILLGFFVLYSHMYSYDAAIFSYILSLSLFIFFLSYNCLLTHFHKKRAFTSEQASEFYIMCNDAGIFFPDDTNKEKAEDIYFVIFGTDKYTGDGTLLEHMVDIYNSGKETTEKQQG